MIGLSQNEIARRLHVTPPTVSYHMRQLGFPPVRQPRYEWNAVQDYYDEGHSARECQRAFGFCSATWNDAVRRGALRSRPPAMPIDDLLGARRNRNHIKGRLIAAGLKTGTCEACGIGDWRGRPLSLALHHINGIRDDNRLENLRLLCPNCHSQTPNFGGRNRPRDTVVEARPLSAAPSSPAAPPDTRGTSESR